MPVYENQTDYLRWKQQMREMTQYARASADEQVVDNIKRLMTKYPWMRPGTTYSLALQNVRGKEAAQIAYADLQHQMEIYTRQYDMHDFAEPKQKLGEVFNELTTYLESDSRQQNRQKVIREQQRPVGEEDYLRQEVAGQEISPSGDTQWTQTHDAYNDLQRGVHWGTMDAASLRALQQTVAVAAQSRDPMIMQGVLNQVRDLRKGGPGMSAFQQAGRAVVRPIAGVLQSGVEATAATLRGVAATAASVPAAFSRLTGERQSDVIPISAQAASESALRNQSTPYEWWVEQTTAGQMALAALQGREIDLGTGLFVSPESKIAQDVGAAARRYSPYLIGGHAWTVGRFAASGFESDSVPFQLLSGAVDGAIAVGLDPANFALSKLGELNRARRLFDTFGDAERYVRAIELADDAVPPPGVIPDDWVTAYRVVAPDTVIANYGPDRITEIAFNEMRGPEQALANFVTDSLPTANYATEVLNGSLRHFADGEELPQLARVEEVRVPPNYFDLQVVPEGEQPYRGIPFQAVSDTFSNYDSLARASLGVLNRTQVNIDYSTSWLDQTAKFSQGAWVPTSEEWAKGAARAERNLEPYGYFIDGDRQMMFQTYDDLAAYMDDHRTLQLSVERRPWVSVNDPARLHENPLFTFFQHEQEAEGTFTAYTDGDNIYYVNNPEQYPGIAERNWRPLEVPRGMQPIMEYSGLSEAERASAETRPWSVEIGRVADLPRYNEPVPYTAIPEAWPGGPRSIHGTTERWVGDVPLQGDPARTGAGHGNLFGPGLYTTADNPELAITRGYRGFENAPVATGGAHYALTWTGEELPRTLNLDDLIRVDLPESQLGRAGEDAADFAERMRGWLRSKQETGFPGATRTAEARYFNWVDDVLRRLENGDMTVGDAWNSIREPDTGAFFAEITIADMEAARNIINLARDDIFNNVLRRNYDALTHVGGGRVQNAIRHDVTIWINQDQLRAARIGGIDELPEDPMDFIPHIGPDTIRTKSDLLREAGAVMGRRSIIRGKNPVTWLYGKGSKVVRGIAQTSSAWDIYWALGGKVPIRSATGANVLADLANATTEAEVRIILSKELGTSIERIPKWDGGATVGSRLWRDMPRGAMRWTDPDGSAKTLIDYMALSKFDKQVQERLFNQLVEATGRGDQYAFMDTLFDTLGEQLKLVSDDPTWVDDFVRQAKTDWDGASRWGINRDTGEDVPLRLEVHEQADDQLPFDVPSEVFDVTGPRWVGERLNSTFYLPDPDAVRRLVANPLWRKATQVGFDTEQFGKLRPWSVMMAMADYGNDAWKGLTLLRMAWPIRVVGEEMIRLSVVGHGPFNNILSYIALVMGNPGRYLDDPWYIKQIAKLGQKDSDEIARIVEQTVDPDEIRRLMDDGASFEDASRIAERTARDNIPDAWGKKLADRLREWRNDVGTYRTDAAGRPFNLNDLYGDALSNRALMTRGDRTLYLNHFDAVSRTGNDSQYWARGLIGELGMANRDVTIQNALRMSEDEFLDALWESPWGRTARDQMAAGRDPGNPNEAAWLRVRDDRAVSDAYGRAVLKELEGLHRGDETLIEAIKTGRLEGVPLSVDGNGSVKPNPKAVKIAEGYREAGAGPDFVRVQRAIMRTWRNKEQDAEQLATVVAALFDALGTRPSNYLTRSPHFRFTYWDEIEKLMPALDTRGTQKVLENLDTANISAARAAKIRRLAEEYPGGTLSWEQADLLSKQRALDNTRDVLYDLHKKSQFFDAARLVMPFGEAWREMLVTWAKLVRDYPQVTNNAQKYLTAVREAPANPITGLPAGMPDLDSEGNYIGGRPTGFFRFDSRTDSEVFTYPLTAWLSKAMGSPLPMPQVGTTSGLSMLTTGLPGVGPAVQIAASKIIPNKPQYDQVKEILFPFGEPQGSTIPQQLFSITAPAWMRRLINSFADPRTDPQFGNLVTDVMASHSSTGEYKIAGARGPNDPTAAEEAERLYNDSLKTARWLSIIQGLAAFGAPSAPSFDVYVKKNQSKPGGETLVLLQQLRDDYRRMVDKLGYEEGQVQFIKTYGVDNIFARVPKSESNVAGLAATEAQRDWERTNPDIVAQFPKTWALFAPAGKASDFNLNVYQSQRDAGYRDWSPPQDVQTRGIAIRAETAWDAVVAQTGGDRPNRNQSYQRAQAKKQLQKWYPGWTGRYSDEEFAAQLAELERAAEEPLTRDTGLGIALREYFMLRDSLNLDALRYSERSTSVLNSRETDSARAWLFGQVDILRARNKNFDRAWDAVLKDEFGDL